ncbi:hypothetical protein O1O06_14085 [Grimontia hollisae]|uniref:hypothetical protein n=1 Tax=Grimontia hollisae TaxID=673 RepID=UPI001303A1C2|nr:hypothetical protein [Grimontia hollisae]MDF2185879.1 hypothetical protein [Grimontia hollisae]
MTLMYIQQRLDRLEQNRLIGKPGLSLDQVRDIQLKLRFTELESELLSLVAQKIGQPKAVLSNVLVIDAVIELLASDRVLCDEIMATWYGQSMPSLDFFQEIHARSRRIKKAIEGECHRKSLPVPLLLEHK